MSSNSISFFCSLTMVSTFSNKLICWGWSCPCSWSTSCWAISSILVIRAMLILALALCGMTSGWNALLDGVVSGSSAGVTIGGVQCTADGRGMDANTLAYRIWPCLHSNWVCENNLNIKKSKTRYKEQRNKNNFGFCKLSLYNLWVFETDGLSAETHQSNQIICQLPNPRRYPNINHRKNRSATVTYCWNLQRFNTYQIRWFLYRLGHR